MSHTNQRMPVELYVIMCPPLKTHPKLDVDVSRAALKTCPHCKQLMWLSEKKKALKKSREEAGHHTIYGCYECVERLIKKDPDFFVGAETLNI